MTTPKLLGQDGVPPLPPPLITVHILGEKAHLLKWQEEKAALFVFCFSFFCHYEPG